MRLQMESKDPEEAEQTESEKFAEMMLKIKLSFVDSYKASLPALHFAAKVGDMEMCRRLLDDGADLRARCSSRGATVLHYAAMNNVHGVEIFDYLIKKGAEIAEDAEGETPIHVANRVKNFQVALKLLEKWGERQFLFCVKSDLLELSKFLVKKDGKKVLKVIGKCGKTALHFAAQSASLEMCQWLIEQGQSIEIANQTTFATFLHYAARNKKHGTKIIRFYGPSLNSCVNRIDFLSYTPLHHALVEENLEAADALITIGANIRVKKYENNNLLHFCILQNKISGAKFVHEKDKHLITEKGERFKTAFQLAAERENVELCQWLVDEGANIDS
ncbi:putative ankyrin repeat protein RF_0381 [Cloeon dipterum]|uniref:putative ankyrin repeat protein RF_0381 n=1 Tax=Cloeon dipterum TaxID=197152 RepID=UPI0032200B84